MSLSGYQRVMTEPTYQYNETSSGALHAPRFVSPYQRLYWWSVAIVASIHGRQRSVSVSEYVTCQVSDGAALYVLLGSSAEPTDLHDASSIPRLCVTNSRAHIAFPHIPKPFISTQRFETTLFSCSSAVSPMPSRKTASRTFLLHRHRYYPSEDIRRPATEMKGSSVVASRGAHAWGAWRLVEALVPQRGTPDRY